MTEMTVGDLHDQTERAVAMAEAGVDVEVTRDGRVVAKLVPVTARRAVGSRLTGAALEEAQARLERLFAKSYDLGGGPLTYEDKYGDAPL